MLGISIRRNDQEFLALPGGLAAYRAGHATGLPVLAPWANRLGDWSYRAAGVDVDLNGVDLHTDDGGLPIHGTMLADPRWEVARIEAEDDRASLTARFDSTDRPDQLRAFPFPHELTLGADVDADGALSVSLKLRATGDRAVPVSFGFHPYFRLPSGRRSQWVLRLPPRRHIELDKRGIPTGDSMAESEETAPIGRRVFDDLYELGPDRRIKLEAWGCGHLPLTRRGVFLPPGFRAARSEVRVPRAHDGSRRRAPDRALPIGTSG